MVHSSDSGKDEVPSGGATRMPPGRGWNRAAFAVLVVITLALIRTIAEPLRVAAMGSPFAGATLWAWIGGALIPALGLAIVGSLWKAGRFRATVGAGVLTVLAMVGYKLLVLA
jgi:hypothetical protein